MSSTLSRPRTRSTVAKPAIPVAVATDAEIATDDEADFRQFVKAIVIGVAFGFPIVLALIVGLVELAAPDFGFWPAVGIGLWVAIWTGMFLGGTVTVGLASKRLHG